MSTRAFIERRNTSTPVALAAISAPLVIQRAGPQAEKIFWQFFTAEHSNRNTRLAYLRAARRFFDWCAVNNIVLVDVEPVHVAAYIETLGQQLSVPSVKQHLAAIRNLFDYLIRGQIVAINPAAAVRGPRHSVKRGKTPVLNSEELRELIDSIDVSNPVGLRDRALIGVMVYTFARVSAAVGMLVEDYYSQKKRSFLRLHEKGGKYHQVPAHLTVQEYLDEYLEAAGIADDPKSPMFLAAKRGRGRKSLSENALTRETALRVIKKVAKKAGLPPQICNHTFRGSGITVYLKNGGTIEKAAAIAAHESTRTTQLYDRTEDGLTVEEIDKISF